MKQSLPQENYQWHPRLDPILKFSPKHLIISQENPSSKNKASRHFTYVEFDKKIINKLFKKDQHLYEILPKDLPRKFAVDIDIKPTHANYNKYTFEQIVNATTIIIKYCYEKIIKKLFGDIKPIVSIVKNLDRKQSLHLIYPIYFEKQIASRYFSKYIESIIINSTLPDLANAQKILKHENELYFDTSIYSVNQNLRMLNQSKIAYPNDPFIPYDISIKDPFEYLTGIYSSIKI
jgi:hypothetical protein